MTFVVFGIGVVVGACVGLLIASLLLSASMRTKNDFQPWTSETGFFG